MRTIIIWFIFFILACDNSNHPNLTALPGLNTSPVEKRDSVITLQMHAKKGERFSFGYIDEVFNFNMVETPENQDSGVYERKIISHKPIFLKDIDVWKQNFFYLVPGETYKIIQDSGFSYFEVVNNTKRTYEVNVLKELKKYNKRLKKFNELDLDEAYSILNFKDMDLNFRDSLLKHDYQENLSFLELYASKNNFDTAQKQIMSRYLFYKFCAARLNFNLKNPGKVNKYLDERSQLYTDIIKELNCDTCFDYPHYYYLASLFARAFVADPRKKQATTVYREYADFFTGQAGADRAEQRCLHLNYFDSVFTAIR